ncbi:hypothetical protein GXM_10487 [Nostoc sphaeroides CCNUC1]|uniref:Lipocalin-like domain-containing protein n=2 Tax=Nostoc sphaeroides TaxID=446679 RepID=A0A5P8WJU9_9NOSO|nr:hypothetical protein GXM_10487 [Nostoc sphaeroides CCNUC1]
MYKEDGYMSVSIMSANRLRFVSKDIAGGTIEEMATAADTYTSYCGTYEIQVNKIIHHIQISMYPNWTGIAQERIFALKDDRLLLSAPPDLIDGKQQTAHFVWKRV